MYESAPQWNFFAIVIDKYKQMNNAVHSTIKMYALPKNKPNVSALRHTSA